ncbi:MAG: DegT/DnrJ/EryC1/StrS family aminotransferase [Desulfurococcales archaeon]|nr:DegT/DnrJ/EryC1/StrS family aminotransferase [Desulfurococcales archaeon]
MGGGFIPIARPILGDEEAEAVVRVLRSGRLAQGPEVRAFEEEFAAYLGAAYAVAVANGTVALDIALKALRIGPGDEVITTPFTFIATSNSILYQGARPVFVDIELETYNIDPDRVLEAIGPRTRAIVAVDLYGHPAEWRALREIAEDYDLSLVEDAAQAHGAEYHGSKSGTLGDVGTFSFYPTKNMTTGEGGMVVTDDPSLARRARLIRDHGQVARYRHAILGYNYRMTEIAAAIGRVQLRRLDEWNEARRRNASLLTRLLSSVECIVPPGERPGARHVYHQYVIRVDVDSCPHLDRDRLAEKLREAGIGTAVHYPRIIPDQPLYRRLGIGCATPCEKARKAARGVLSLPVHPLLGEPEVRRVAGAVEEAVAELSRR